MRSLRIEIAKLTPRRMGGEVELCVNIISLGGDAEINREERKLTVASKMLFEIGNIGANVLPYELTAEQFDILEYDAVLWEAVKKGIDLLSFGDNTRRQLETKLRARGYDAELAAEAAEYIEKSGLIDEGRMLERYVKQLADSKLYGPVRIRQELMRRGFSRETISGHFEDALCEIDFDANLRRLIERKCDPAQLDDRKYREAFIASMYRLGYDPGCVRQGLKEFAEEQAN